MRAVLGSPFPTSFNATIASAKGFPALIGQSMSLAFLQCPDGTTNPPHTHPRSAELLFLIDGTLQVGFLDTTNKLFNQTLPAGDMFIFPKGLVHLQYNADTENPAVAISAFGRANAGTMSIPVTVFGTGIDDDILAESFKTDVATVEALDAALTPPSN